MYTPAVRRAAEEGSLGTGKRQRPDMTDVFSFFFFLFGSSFVQFLFGGVSKFVRRGEASLAMMVGC